MGARREIYYVKLSEYLGTMSDTGISVYSWYLVPGAIRLVFTRYMYLAVSINVARFIYFIFNRHPGSSLSKYP